MSQGIVGILLAAGVGSRFGSDKLLHRLPNGIPMAAAAAASLQPACERVAAVLRPGNDALAALLSAVGCEIVTCPEASGGMGYSLAAGIRATADASGWIVALADMPFISSSSHLMVASCLRNGASLAATHYHGRQGHPVGFSGEWRAQLSSLTGDRGGKAILDAHREQLTICHVDDSGVTLDIDRPEDLANDRALSNGLPEA